MTSHSDSPPAETVDTKARSFSGPSIRESALMDRAYYDGAQQCLLMAEQSIEAARKWVLHGCGGRLEQSQAVLTQSREPTPEPKCTCTPAKSEVTTWGGTMTSAVIDPKCPLHWRQTLIQNGSPSKASGCQCDFDPSHGGSQACPIHDVNGEEVKLRHAVESTIIREVVSDNAGNPYSAISVPEGFEKLHKSFLESYGTSRTSFQTLEEFIATSEAAIPEKASSEQILRQGKCEKCGHFWIVKGDPGTIVSVLAVLCPCGHKNK